MRWYLTGGEAGRRWRRDAKGRGQRIQYARGKSAATVSAIVVHFRESFMAIGAVNVYGHTHFLAKIRRNSFDSQRYRRQSVCHTRRSVDTSFQIDLAS